MLNLDSLQYDIEVDIENSRYDFVPVYEKIITELKKTYSESSLLEICEVFNELKEDERLTCNLQS